jgi:hypothetical protein
VGNAYANTLIEEVKETLSQPLRNGVSIVIENNRRLNIAMKNWRLTLLLQLTAIGLLGLFLTAAAQGAYTDGKAAQLKASDIKRLKALRAPIAVPTYVPAGYKLKDAGGRVEMIGKFWSVDYGLTYENAKGDSLEIISANEGLGDLPFTVVLSGNNPYFGAIDVGTQDITEDGKVKANAQYETDWVENKPAYVPKGARSRRQAYRVHSTALSAKEVLKVKLSLRYLR